MHLESLRLKLQRSAIPKSTIARQTGLDQGNLTRFAAGKIGINYENGKILELFLDGLKPQDAPGTTIAVQKVETPRKSLESLHETPGTPKRNDYLASKLAKLQKRGS